MVPWKEETSIKKAQQSSAKDSPDLIDSIQSITLNEYNFFHCMKMKSFGCFLDEMIIDLVLIYLKQ